MTFALIITVFISCGQELQVFYQESQIRVYLGPSPSYFELNNAGIIGQNRSILEMNP